MLADINCKMLGVNNLSIGPLSIPRKITNIKNEDIIKKILDSPFYKDIILYFHNLECPTYQNKS